MKRPGVCVLVVVVMLAVSSLASTAWAAALSITSKPVGAHARAKPSFYPHSLLVANCGVLDTTVVCLTPQARTPENGDTVTIVFPTIMNQGSLCSAWADSNTTNRSTTVTATIKDNAGATGNDTLSITASTVVCDGGMKFGTIDLGHSGYVGADINYSTTSFVLSKAGTTPRIDLDLKGGTKGTTVASGTGTRANYACHTALLSSTGASCAPSRARTVATEQF